MLVVFGKRMGNKRSKKMIDLNLFKNIMQEVRTNPNLLDSYSPNQFKSKERLLDLIKNLNMEFQDVVIQL